MNNELAVKRGNNAKLILDNAAWNEAWEAYRARIFEEIEKAGSDEIEKVLHLKRLLSAAGGARGHLERLMAEGKVAAANIKFEEEARKRGFMERILG